MCFNNQREGLEKFGSLRSSHRVDTLGLLNINIWLSSYLVNTSVEALQIPLGLLWENFLQPDKNHFQFCPILLYQLSETSIHFFKPSLLFSRDFFVLNIFSFIFSIALHHILFLYHPRVMLFLCSQFLAAKLFPHGFLTLHSVLSDSASSAHNHKHSFLVVHWKTFLSW